MIRFRSFATGVALTALATGPTLAQEYGRAVAVGEREVFIAQPGTEFAPGTVFLYHPGTDGWTQAAALRASDGTDGDHFGQAIALGGDLLIGATATDDSRGAAYVFTRDASGWHQQARLTLENGMPGDAFGSAVAIDGDLALVAAAQADSGVGAVYVFHRSGDTWTRDAQLKASGVKSGDRFGTAIAVSGSVALVSAPRKDRNKGAVFVFRRNDDGTWRVDTTLEGPDLRANNRFGTAVAFDGHTAWVGAPGQNGFAGAVYPFRYSADDQEWTPQPKLVAFDATNRARFSTALAINGSEIWVGAPGTDEFEGRAYVFTHDDAGRWTGVTKVGTDSLETRDGFAGTVAARGDVAVAGILGDDYGAGTAAILERVDGHWMTVSRVWADAAGPAIVVDGEIDCTDGAASAFGCNDVDLLSFLPVSALGGSRGVRLNDIWGWTDPQTGHEWALVGRIDGTAFVDVTDPYHPRYAGQLPKTPGARASAWRDIKVYRDHAFIVSDGAGEHGMQVFDLNQLRDVTGPPVTFEPTAFYDRIASAHNIVINEETGYAFSVGGSSGGETCGGGLHMINIQDPEHPTFAGCFADPSTGRRKTGYSHDAQCVTYHGPDQDHAGREICFGANETALSIADVTDKEHPTALAMASYPNVGYTHQGWLTDDQRYFFMDDELDEIAGNVTNTRTLIWDVSDLDDPVLVKEHMSENRSSDHNLYIRGNRMYQSNYVSGLRVLDISDVENPVEIGYFDTVPYGEDAPGFNGSWSNYPFFKSGIVVVTSVREGLFVVKPKPREIIP